MGKLMPMFPIDKNKAVFFTAHRFNFIPKDKLAPVEAACRKFLKDAIIAAVFNGYTHFLNGGALGGDTWAAEEVLALKPKYPQIRLVMCEPYWGRYLSWSLENQERYLTICRAADSIVTVTDEPYAKWKMHARNSWMVDRSTLGIALLRSDTDKGGTFSCVQYAKRKNIYVDIFDPLPHMQEIIDAGLDKVRCANYDRVDF